MTRRPGLFPLLFAVLTAALLLFRPAPAAAEEISDPDFGYSLDLPEGFTVADHTDDGMSYLFVHNRMPVQFVIKLYAPGTSDTKSQSVFSTSRDAYTGALKKLSAKAGNTDSFTWRDESCTIGQFSMNIGKEYSGWALAVPLAAKKAQLVVLCYADSAKEKDCDQFIMSCLNSLCIDRASRRQPGPVTSYAFPDSGVQKITLTIGGKTIPTEINASDAEAARFVIGCEYAVLTLYANDKMWKEAWQRYYRAIFRDSCARLRKCSLDIYTALEPDAAKKSNHDAAIAQELLTWTQGFSYKRGSSSSSDFTSLPDCLLGEGNDCDSRSLLVCTLLENMGIKSMLFISQAYSHALFGVASDAPGQTIDVNGTKYLLGETTAHVTLGMIAKDMSDRSKWISVELP